MRNLTCSRKFWYAKLICLVRGLILGELASSNALELSSKALQLALFRFLK